MVGKNHSRHYLQLHEAAAWILNAVQWVNVLEQPMMIVIWSKDWEDAPKFQYLMQILQVNLEDYIPKWQIFVDQPETVDKLILQWQNPTTIWTGQPVLGFMAETDFEDLATVGLKDFNPMWSFPSTSVSQNWEHITFSMDASHLKEDPGHEKDALVLQCPIVVFKAATVLQSLVIMASRIVLPSSDVKGGKKNRTNILPNYMELCLCLRHSIDTQ